MFSKILLHFTAASRALDEALRALIATAVLATWLLPTAMISSESEARSYSSSGLYISLAVEKFRSNPVIFHSAQRGGKSNNYK